MLLNETSLNKSACLTETQHPQHMIPVLYFLIFPTSLALNGIAAWVSLYLNSKATFVVYLKNLLAADLIMTFILPFDALKDLNSGSEWLLVLMCRYLSTIFYSTMYTSISLLGLISVDRWLKIMMPRNRLPCHNIQFSKFMSAAVWLILFGFTCLPNIILTNRSEDSMGEVQTCMDLKGPLGLEVHQLIIICLNVYFWIVSLLMVVCYVCIAHKVIESFKRSGSNNKQGKQRMKYRIFSVVIVFFISFSPYHIIRIPYTFQQVSSDNCAYIQGKFAKQVSLFLATVNICLSPLLYAFLCYDFRKKLMSLLKDLDIPLPIDLTDKDSSASTQPSNKAPVK
ncbi:P2Y purinoceptor 13-like [Synchiropus splendidus]|uniref:P2Y purinoceptor 13-like n=1 Tax=Synchiropus splendidus TaxID=270530 RepID=UPI00237DA7EB|nr:P2Y purinoceptor 13-like [Synchiropus splendidus]